MRYLNNCLLGVFIFSSQALVAGEVIIIDSEDDWAPYSSKVGDHSEGFAVDLNREIFKAVGVEAKFPVVPYARCTHDIETLTEVVGCFDTARNDSNEKNYLWPDQPMFTAKVLVWTRKDNPANNLTYKDLIGKKVGMTNGYEYGSEFDNSKEIDKKVSVSDENLFKMLAAGRVDYIVAYELPGLNVLKKLGKETSDLIKSAGTISELKLYVSFSNVNKNAQHALELYNKGMDLVKKNGTYERLEKELMDKLKN